MNYFPGRSLILTAKDVITSGSHLGDLLARVQRIYHPHRDRIVLDEFNDYLYQSSYTDETGYTFTLREHPCWEAGKNRELITRLAKEIVSSISLSPKSVRFVNDETESGHLIVRVFVITSINSIGD